MEKQKQKQREEAEAEAGASTATGLLAPFSGSVITVFQEVEGLHAFHAPVPPSIDLREEFTKRVQLVTEWNGQDARRQGFGQLSIRFCDCGYLHTTYTMS